MAISQVSIDIYFRYRKFSLLKKWLQFVISSEKFVTGNISLVFVSDEYLLSVNSHFLKKDYFTDIITFDYSEDNVISGDLLISIDRVKNNSVLYKVLFYNELDRVIIHGILHLLGYNDLNESEKVEMKTKEDYYLKNK